MELLQPGTWQEALEARAAHPGALPLQGGTDVMVDLNFGRERPEAILDLTRVARARRVGAATTAALRVGAGRHATRARSPSWATALPGLAAASRTVGSPQIRNRGTIGGNLGSSSPAGDALPPLYASDAEVELASPRGTRRVPIADFITGPKRNVLAPRRADRRLPRAPAARAAAVLQGRHPQRDGDRGLLVRARAAPGGARGRHLHRLGRRRRRSRAAEAEAFAAGDARLGRRRRPPTTPTLAPLRRARGRRPRAPIDDVRGSAAYRRHALSVLARRTLGLGLERAVRLTCTSTASAREVDGLWEGESLLHVLRERLGLPGAKNACEQGECGSCSVYLDGALVCSCLVLAGQAEGREVVTVEGLAAEDELHPVQEAFLDAGAVQCGFCTPGLIVATARPAGAQAGPDRRGDPRGAGRQPVPLHGLREDPRRGARWRRARDEPARHRGLRDRHRRRRGHRARRRAPRHPPRLHRRGRRRPGAARRGRRASASTAAACSPRPGLVNCHHHLYQWATRGLAQEATLFEWLQALYPVWAHVDEEIERAAARAGLAALARSGCTTASDHHYLFPRDGGDLLAVEIEAARELGLRFHPCRGSMDLGRSDGGLPPDEVVEDRDAILAACEAAIDRYHDPSPDAMLRIALAPCSPFSRHPGADARVGRAGPRARRAPAHAHGRDRGRGALLPRAVRLPARSSTWSSSAGSATTSGSPTACTSTTREVQPLRRDRHRASRTARAPTRGSARASRPCRRWSARARRSGSASTAPPPTRRASWAASCARRCWSRGWRATARRR